MWSRDELASAYEIYAQTTQSCALSGRWDSWADLFTEDVVFRVDRQLVWRGREAIRQGAVDFFKEPPQSFMRHFLFEWHVIDEEQGWVVFEITQRMDDPGDGSIHQLPCLMRIQYGGKMEWKVEDDYYDPARMEQTLNEWQRVKNNELTHGRDAQKEEGI